MSFKIPWLAYWLLSKAMVPVVVIQCVMRYQAFGITGFLNDHRSPVVVPSAPMASTRQYVIRGLGACIGQPVYGAAYGDAVGHANQVTGIGTCIYAVFSWY